MRRATWSLFSGMVCLIFLAAGTFGCSGASTPCRPGAGSSRRARCQPGPAPAWPASGCPPPGPRSAARPLACRSGPTGRGPWCSTRRGSGPARGQAAPRARPEDSCSFGPAPRRRPQGPRPPSPHARRPRAGAPARWWSRSTGSPGSARPPAVLLAHRCDHPLVGAVRRPQPMPLPHRLIRPESVRKVTPRGTCPEPPDDPLQRGAVVIPRPTPTTRILRHHRPQHIPQLVTDHAITKHESHHAQPEPRSLAQTRPRPRGAWFPKKGGKQGRSDGKRDLTSGRLIVPTEGDSRHCRAPGCRWASEER